VRAAGALLAVLGLALAVRSAMLLAGRGRPERGPRPALVLAGPYRRMRNPLFAGMVLALVGGGLATGSGPLVVAGLGGAAAAHLWVLRVEEPRLRERFGRAYAEYLRRVPRWLPRRARQDDGALAEG
jgi:protein-S-isoprenylcysteine O-methyltransferase Ste14